MLSWFPISTNLAKVYFALEHHNMLLIAVWSPTIFKPQADPMISVSYFSCVEAVISRIQQI